MQEKKKFILAVPTVIVIIIFIIGMSLIYYNKNYKPLSQEEALNLAKRAVAIDNLSCQVVVKQNDNESTTDYKRNSSKVYIKADDYIELVDTKSNECTYIDEENKEVYKYVSDSVLESFNSIIYAGIQALQDSTMSYSFEKYEKINGIKCAAVKVKDKSTEITMWIDRDTGMLAKFEIVYKADEEEDSKTEYIYRYQIGSVTDDDLKLPSTEDYTLMDYSE